MDFASFLAGFSIIPALWLGLKIFTAIEVVKKLPHLDEVGAFCAIMVLVSGGTFTLAPTVVGFEQIFALPANLSWLVGCSIAFLHEAKVRNDRAFSSA